MKIQIITILLVICTMGMIITVHVKSIERDTLALDLINTNQKSIILLLENSLDLANAIKKESN